MADTNLDSLVLSGSLTAASANYTGGATNAGKVSQTPSVVAAAGANQTAATLIGDVYTVRVTVTSSAEGVKLPVATTGRMILVYVPGTVGVKIYPNTNGQIDSVATNGALALVAGKGILFQAANATHWYTAIKGA